MSRSFNKNIGILGGSFDPPHKGHLFISKKSLELFKLKKVVWAITKKNPLKKKPFFSLQNRKKMCLKLIKKNNRIELRHYEKKINSNASVDLIKFLKKKMIIKFFSFWGRIIL